MGLHENDLGGEVDRVWPRLLWRLRGQMQQAIVEIFPEQAGHAAAEN